jgi:hypothetical protein
VNEKLFHLPFTKLALLAISPLNLTNKSKVRKRSVNRVSVNECAQCRADIIAPYWSEHLGSLHPACMVMRGLWLSVRGYGLLVRA